MAYMYANKNSLYANKIFSFLFMNGLMDNNNYIGQSMIFGWN